MTDRALVFRPSRSLPLRCAPAVTTSRGRDPTPRGVRPAPCARRSREAASSLPPLFLAARMSSATAVRADLPAEVGDHLRERGAGGAGEGSGRSVAGGGRGEVDAPGFDGFGRGRARALARAARARARGGRSLSERKLDVPMVTLGGFCRWGDKGSDAHLGVGAMALPRIWLKRFTPMSCARRRRWARRGRPRPCCPPRPRARPVAPWRDALQHRGGRDLSPSARRT